MPYKTTNLHAIIIFNSVALLLPKGNCEEIITVDHWSGKIDKAAAFATRKPFSRSKITVPQFLQLENEDEYTDHEIFRTFLYVLISVCIVIAMYYCFKCCNCMKACSNLMSSLSQGSRRNPIHRTGAIRRNRNRTNRTRIGRHGQRYERMLTGHLNSSRSHSTNLFGDNCNHEERPIRVASSDRPPDYSTVILGDLVNEQVIYPEVKSQEALETPPPSYEENVPIGELRQTHNITEESKIENL